jgi:hypothetical protein
VAVEDEFAEPAAWSDEAAQIGGSGKGSSVR